MSRFAISDHHLRHPRIYRFETASGARLRPWAETCEEGDEMMIAAHNAVVHPKDTVYFLGDVAIARTGLALLDRMNGRKILIRGNHDIFKLNDYLPYFADIRGSHKIDRLKLTHEPIHPASIPAWCHANLHGHLHGTVVMMQAAAGREVPDPRYINLSIETAGLAPTPVEEIIETARKRTETRDLA